MSQLSNPPIRVCFVCLGNICRSPTAEGVMRHLVLREALDHAIEIASAGTGAWHAGEPPDERSQEAALKRGIELTSVARQFLPRDFARFDYVLAMDKSNRENLLRLAPDDRARGKVRLLRDLDPDSPKDSDVPDPYYGSGDGFERVLDMCEAACRHLIAELRKNHSL